MNNKEARDIIGTLMVAIADSGPEGISRKELEAKLPNLLPEDIFLGVAGVMKSARPGLVEKDGKLIATAVGILVATMVKKLTN